ncbi:MAG: response regulator transcription factor [Acidobacteria bacterium]|nr:response regulator transcription factor [Acidobacteriota bacterium]
MKLLVVEDSDRLRRSLGNGLSKLGYAVDLARDGEEGLAFLEAYEYDAVILDLMLPKVNGLEVLRRARSAGRDAHVLVLSARDHVADRISGLEAGADDYIVKPFDFDELCARIQALMRRRFHKKNPSLEIGPLVIETTCRRASCLGSPLNLTPSEYALLELLALRQGQVFSQSKLQEHLYPGASEVSSNVIEVMISSLRRKIDEAGGGCVITTRRGFGYLIEPMLASA